jgi:hypothetical protein
VKTKLVSRYYCDHCKKAGCSKHHIAKHEQACTANPDRVCGVCRVMGKKQRPISDLMSVLTGDATDETGMVQDVAYESLREACGQCPACILAAIRQSGAWHPAFDFKGEMAGVFAAVNGEPVVEGIDL